MLRLETDLLDLKTYDNIKQLKNKITNQQNKQKYKHNTVSRCFWESAMLARHADTYKLDEVEAGGGPGPGAGSGSQRGARARANRETTKGQ